MSDQYKLIIDEDFSAGKGMDNWWIEGGEKVFVEDGGLQMYADNVDVPGGQFCTAWCKTPHPANLELECDVRIIGSSVKANNINFFFCYTDPSGASLFETRETRKLAEYTYYHELSGHIVTFLNDQGGEGGRHEDGSTKARIRIRRCPGFELLDETFDGRCEEDVLYRLKVRKTGGEITFFVNGRETLRTVDPNPLDGGLMGLRTWCTNLKWNNIRLTEVACGT